MDNNNEAYLENEFDEKWKKLPLDDEAFKMIDKACKQSKYASLGPLEVCEVEDDDYYVAHLCGGKNGPGEWPKYMEDITRVVNALDVKKWWMIDTKNDCLDDIFYIRLAFRMK